MGLAVMPTDTSILTKTLIEVEIEDGDEGEDGLIDLSPISLKLTDADCGERLDKVLSKLVPQYSRSRIQQWIEAGYVTMDGQPARDCAGGRGYHYIAASSAGRTGIQTGIDGLVNCA